MGTFDVLIRNGSIVDGEGTPLERGDVAFRGSKLAAVGGELQADATIVIEGTGLVVCPGFIDVHTHSDLVLRSCMHNYAKALQGVTTELLGLDGLSYAPASHSNLLMWRDYLAGLNGKPEMAWDWQTVSEFMEGFEGRSPSNVAYLVPHGALRVEALGMKPRQPTVHEMTQMCALLDRGMDDGAFGLSTALTYVPCSHSSTNELVALGEVVACHGGVFMVHWRRIDDDHIRPLEEVIEIGRRAHVAVHVSHLQVSGSRNRGLSSQILRRIDEARDEGVDLTFDCYPYTAGNSLLATLLPGWAWEEGPQRVMGFLNDKVMRRRLAEELRPLPAGWNRVYLTSVPSDGNRDLEGLDMDTAAQTRGMDVPQFICHLLRQEQLAVTFLMHNSNEDDLRNIMRHQAGMFASDGILIGGRPHPRGYGTFPRILGKYVREEGLMKLEEAVRRMTSFPAGRLGLRNRGALRPGLVADVVVFDPRRIRDTATFEDGPHPPEGVEYVFVRGEAVVHRGEPTGATPGAVLHGRRRTTA